jgi:hypothetical protein
MYFGLGVVQTKLGSASTSLLKAVAPAIGVNAPALSY